VFLPQVLLEFILIVVAKGRVVVQPGHERLANHAGDAPKKVGKNREKILLEVIHLLDIRHPTRSHLLHLVVHRIWMVQNVDGVLVGTFL
jgi:hypothetical protein